MVNRSNWYYDHPPACTCAHCNESRRRKLTRRVTSRTITRPAVLTILSIAGLVIWEPATRVNWRATTRPESTLARRTEGGGLEGVNIPEGVNIRDSEDNDRSRRSFNSSGGRRRSGLGGLIGLLVSAALWVGRTWLGRT